MAQRSISSKGVTATLWAVVEEIDDDDEDILEVTIDVANDSNWDLWDISGDIRAMDGTHAHPRGAPSRIESGEGDELVFWVPSDTGAWLFKIEYNTDSGAGTVELGPFANDLRIEAKSRPERIVKEKVDSTMKVAASVADPMAAAFGSALDGFGEEEEVVNPVLAVDAGSDDPIQAAFAGGLLAAQEAPAPLPAPPSPPPSAPAPAPQPPTAPSPEQFGQPPSPPPGPPTGPPPSGPPSAPPGKPPGPPPSGSPPGPPPKSGKPPGPPPS